MFMNINEFTDQQKQAVVDLLVLGMYADGNLDLIEDEKARRVLDSIQFKSDSARQYFLDASFAPPHQSMQGCRCSKRIGLVIE